MSQVTDRPPRVVLIQPHSGQQKILDGLKRFTVIRMGRRFGKTALSIRFLFDYAPRGIASGYPTAWFAATNKVLEDAWLEAKDAFAEITRDKNEVMHRLRFTNGASLEFWSLEADVVARSRHYGAIVVDEAAHAPKLEKQWPRQIRPTLIQDQGWAMFASTPAGQNYFHKLDQNSIARANWASFHAPSWSNPYLKPVEIEDARLDSTALEFSQEYGAEYVNFGGTLVTPDMCQPAALLPEGAIVLGVDLAISKKDTADYSAIVAMQQHIDGGIYVKGAIRFRAHFNEVLEEIKKAAAHFGAALIVIEEVQYQAAVTQELLRTTHLPVVGWRPDVDKLRRFLPLAARYEKRLVFHERAVPAEFTDEICSFTGVDDAHDDFVDAASCAYHALSLHGGKVASAGKSALGILSQMPGADQRHHAAIGRARNRPVPLVERLLGGGAR